MGNGGRLTRVRRASAPAKDGEHRHSVWRGAQNLTHRACQVCQAALKSRFVGNGVVNSDREEVSARTSGYADPVVSSCPGRSLTRSPSGWFSWLELSAYSKLTQVLAIVSLCKSRTG